MQTNRCGQLFAEAEKMARRGDVDGLRRLVDGGFDVRTLANARGFTFALHAADGKFVDERLARFLFRECRIDPSEKVPTASGMVSPFDLLVSNLDAGVARVLFSEAERTVSPEWRDAKTGDGILSKMAKRRSAHLSETMAFLVEVAGVRPDARNNDGLTAGHCFAMDYNSPVLFASWAGYVSPEASEEALIPRAEWCEDDAKLARKLAHFVRFVRGFVPCEEPFVADESGYGEARVRNASITGGHRVLMFPAVYNRDVVGTILRFAESFGDDERIVFAEMFAPELDIWKNMPDAENFVFSAGAILAAKARDEGFEENGFPAL